MNTMTTTDTTRFFIRHPADIPITYLVENRATDARDVKNLSTGGVCFTCDEYLEPGKTVHVSIPYSDLDASIDGEVVWCSSKGIQFEVGVKFIYSVNPFHFRQVEQLCQIEHYRRNVLLDEGRNLSREDAAKEWITQFAADFPKVD